MQITNNIGYLLNHLAFVLNRQSDQVLQERLGIGFSQFKILMVLKWNPLIKQKDIAERLGQTEASISRQIKLLHKSGMLQTIVRPENRRQHITVLTAKGERIIDESLIVLNDYHAPVFNRLTGKQQAVLMQLLKDMHSEACRYIRPGACQDISDD